MAVDWPITVPTLRAIIARVQTDVVAELDYADGGSDAFTRGTFTRGAVRALGGLSSELYGFAARVLTELLPDSAVDWGVTRWARILGIERIPAQACVVTGSVTFLGPGTLPAGTVLTRQSDGAEYTVNANVVRGSAGTQSGTFTASAAGVATALEANEALVISSPPSNVYSLVLVTGVTTDGADIETLASVKARILARLARPPQGGTADDYEAWAQAYDSTIERLWVLEAEPYLGAVTIYFAIAGDDADMVPDGSAATALQAELRAKAPVHSAELVFVSAPTGRSIEIDITLSPDNAIVQGYVEDELRALLRNWTGEMDGTGVVEEDDIRNAVRAGVKRYSSTGTFTVNTIEGAAPANITLAAGVLPYLGTITF